MLEHLLAISRRGAIPAVLAWDGLAHKPGRRGAIPTWDGLAHRPSGLEDWSL